MTGQATICPHTSVNELDVMVILVLPFHYNYKLQYSKVLEQLSYDNVLMHLFQSKNGVENRDLEPKVSLSMTQNQNEGNKMVKQPNAIDVIGVALSHPCLIKSGINF